MSNAYLFPSNPQLYNAVEAFNHFTLIDWNQRVQCQVGDTVYIYCSAPFKKIMFSTEVIAVNLSPDEIIHDDEIYNISGIRDTSHPPKYGYVRLKLIHKLSNEEAAILSFANFKKLGFDGNPQSQRQLKEDFKNFAESLLAITGKIYS